MLNTTVDADRLLPGGAGAQSAATRQHGRSRVAPTSRNMNSNTTIRRRSCRDHAARALRDAAGHAQQPGYDSSRAAMDGYIYPADGSSSEQVYPAPRRAQVYPPL